LFPGVTYLLQVKCLPSASSAAHCRHLQNAYITLMIIFILSQWILLSVYYFTGTFLWQRRWLWIKLTVCYQTTS